MLPKLIALPPAITNDYPVAVIKLTGTRETYEWGYGFLKDAVMIDKFLHDYVFKELAALYRDITGKELPDKRFLSDLHAEVRQNAEQVLQWRYEELQRFLYLRLRSAFAEDIARGETQKDSTVIYRSGERLALFEGCNPFLDERSLRDTLNRLLTTDSYNILNKDEHNALMERAQSSNPLTFSYPIDDIPKLLSDITEKPQSLCIILGDINSTASQLLLFGEKLLDHWSMLIRSKHPSLSPDTVEAFFLKHDIRVTFIANDNYVPRAARLVFQRNTTLKNVEELLQLEELAGTKRYRDRGLITIGSYHSFLQGAVLTELEQNTALAHTITKSNHILILGEQNCVVANTLIVPNYRICRITDPATRLFTGIYASDNKAMCLRVPSGISPARGFSPELETMYDAESFWKLTKVITEPELYMLAGSTSDTESIIETALQADCITEQHKDAIRSFEKVSVAKEQLLFSRAWSTLGGEYRRADFTHEDRKQRLHMVYLPNNALQTMNVDFYQTIDKLPGQSLALVTDMVRPDDDVMLTVNGSYYLMQVLIDEMNTHAPHFRLAADFEGMYLGPFYCNDQHQQSFLPPLYNKGAIGIKHNGEYVFGRITAPAQGSVQIITGTATTDICWTNINNDCRGGREITLYTPQYDRHRDSYSFNSGFQNMEVARYLTPDTTNYNIVFIGDRLIGIVQGQTEIPPVGLVVSVPAAVFERDCQILCRYVTESSSIKDVSRMSCPLADFSSMLSPEWNDCRWIAGGGTLVISQGYLACFDIHKPGNIWETEGWNTDTSQRTQRSQLHVPSSSARSLVGVTQSGRLFFSVLEGRIRIQGKISGLTIEDFVTRVYHECRDGGDPALHAVLLDSGQPVQMQSFRTAQGNPLNLTCRRGRGTKVGHPRPLSSFFAVSVKKTD